MSHAGERGSARQKDLRPREHGAYAALAFPLATGLVVGGGSVAGIAFAVATTALFWAHEPAAVLLGKRGGRARVENRTQARRVLLVTSSVALAATLAFVAFAPPQALVSAAVPAVLAAIAGVLLREGRERTLIGEGIVAAALATTALPTALAGGTTSLRFAVLVAAVWTIALVLGVATVRGIIAEAKAAGRAAWEGRSARVAAGFFAVLSAASLVRGWLPATIAMALVAASTVLFVISIWRPHPRRLRHVGWALVALDFVTLAALLAAPWPG